MKNTLRIALSAALLWSTASQAEIFLGAGIGQSDIDDSAHGVTLDETDNAWKLYGGMMVTENFGFDAEVKKRAQLEVNVEVIGERRDLPAEMNTTLFRVAQEALTNTVKHAHASYAEIRLSFEENIVRLSILDNGRGFDSAKVQASGDRHWGLLGMRERASLLGGTVTRLKAAGGEARRWKSQSPTINKRRWRANEDTPASGG